MDITKTETSVSWIYDGKPCTYSGEKIELCRHMAQYEAVAVLDSGTLYAYNYNGLIRFIVRAEGPTAFSVRDVLPNGYIICYYPNLPGRLYTCVIDWQTGTMQMKVRYE